MSGPQERYTVLEIDPTNDKNCFNWYWVLLSVIGTLGSSRMAHYQIFLFRLTLFFVLTSAKLRAKSRQKSHKSLEKHQSKNDYLVVSHVVYNPEMDSELEKCGLSILPFIFLCKRN